MAVGIGGGRSRYRMIGKQTKGRGFRGALNYLLGKDGAQLIGGNMIGDNPRDLAGEFGEVRKLRPKLERAVYHASLSLPPGESLSDDQWNAVASRYTDEMGFSGTQFVVVRHRDTAHDHVHILASRVCLDGSVVPESHDFRRSELAIRGIERDFGLARVAPSREADRRAPTTGELRKGLREGRPSIKYRMQGLVATAAGGQPTGTEFIDRLEQSGVQVIPHLASTGRVSGISFSLDGERMKGSDLGRGFSWAGLQTKGVRFEYDRDLQRLRQARARFDQHGITHDRRGAGRPSSGVMRRRPVVGE